MEKKTLLNSLFCKNFVYYIALFLLYFCTHPATIYAGDYTLQLDENGTWENGGWINIGSKGVGPGDTIYIPAGSHGFLCLQNVLGSAVNPVIITNSGGQTVLDTDSNHTLQFYNGKYFKLMGTPGEGYDYGIKIAGSGSGKFGLLLTQRTTDFEVCNIEICDTASIGIQAKSSEERPDWVMENVKIHGNYIHDTGGEGMYIGSSFWVSQNAHELHNIEIYDNYLENTGWDGIQLSCATQNSSIHDNVIINAGCTANNVAQDESIRVGVGTKADIYNNWIEGGAGCGIMADVYGGSVIANNVIIDSSESAIYLTDEHTFPAAGGSMYVMNNTIINPADDGLQTRVLHLYDNLFYNNIVVNAGDQNVHYRYSGTNLLFTESNNLYVSTLSAAGFVDGANYDYHLTASSDALDAGADVSTYGIDDDIEGTSRPQGGYYDIGAYEREAAINTWTIITPAAWGQSGSAYCPAAGAFDDQPTWDDENDEPSGWASNGYAATGTGYENRYWYVDFGPDWADLRICQTWTRYCVNAAATFYGMDAVYWDDDSNYSNGYVSAASGLSFATGTSVPSGQQSWIMDSDVSGSPITPQARYLIIATGSPNPGWGTSEFIFVGYTDGGEEINEAPSVDAGNNVEVDITTGASLDGTVSDDGLPEDPGTVSVLWTKISGPGTVTFDDEEAVDTTASFSAAGTYVLRLTADDGELTAYDEVTVTVISYDIITPTAWGQSGSAYCPAAGAFDDQPTWDGENGEPSGWASNGYAATGTGYENRYWYVDFGPDWADLRICQTWTRYCVNAASTFYGMDAVYWDDDSNYSNGYVSAASGLSFATGTSVPSGQQSWIMDSDVSSSPITPQARYLIISTGSPNPGWGSSEFIFVGYTVGD